MRIVATLGAEKDANGEPGVLNSDELPARFTVRVGGNASLVAAVLALRRLARLVRHATKWHSGCGLGRHISHSIAKRQSAQWMSLGLARSVHETCCSHSDDP